MYGLITGGTCGGTCGQVGSTTVDQPGIVYITKQYMDSSPGVLV